MWDCSVMMVRVFIFFLIAFLFSWNVVKAQEANEVTPPKLIGNWVATDCAGYTEALLPSLSFYLKANKQGLYFGKLDGYSKASDSDYWVVHFDAKPKALRIEEDGILRLLDLPEKGTAPKVWGKLDPSGMHEYTACAEVPKILPALLERPMRYVDRIKEACTLTDAGKACRRVIYKLTDMNSDQKITASEIKRTFISALLLARLLDHAEQGPLSPKAASEFGAKAIESADSFAEKLIKAQDKDGSGYLDYNEIAEDISAPKNSEFKEALEHLGDAFPAFKLAAMGM